MKNILIIGGNGFIGTAIQKILSKQKEINNIIILDKRDRRFKCSIDEKIISVAIDLENKSILKQLMEKYSITHVIDLYSASTPVTSNNLIEVDIKSTLLPFINLLNICIELNIQKILYASSGGAIYGNISKLKIDEETCAKPISSYGIIKHTCEQYLELYHRLHGLNYNSMRISNPFGPMQDPLSKQGVIAKFVYHALHKKTIEIWGDGSIIKDYIHVDDVATAFLDTLNIKESGNVNIGSGQGVSINELIVSIEKILDCKIQKKYTPKKKHDIERNVLSIEKAKQILKWKPDISLYDGILETIKWQRKYYEI